MLNYCVLTSKLILRISPVIVISERSDDADTGSAYLGWQTTDHPAQHSTTCSLLSIIINLLIIIIIIIMFVSSSFTHSIDHQETHNHH